MNSSKFKNKYFHEEQKLGTQSRCSQMQWTDEVHAAASKAMSDNDYQGEKLNWMSETNKTWQIGTWQYLKIE